MTEPEITTGPIAILAGACKPLLLGGLVTDPRVRQMVDHLVALGALLLTTHPVGYFPGAILDLGQPDPETPLPADSWRHAEEACKQADVVVVLGPVNTELQALADLAAWSGAQCLALSNQPGMDESPAESSLDPGQVLAWLARMPSAKESHC